MMRLFLRLLLLAPIAASAQTLYPADTYERLTLLGVADDCYMLFSVPGGVDVRDWTCTQAQPSPAELVAATDAALLTDRRQACERQAHTALDAAISAELSTTEQIVIRTDPVPEPYTMRREWVDAQIAIHDALVDADGPLQSATDPAALQPCPAATYQSFSAWEAGQ